jgi:hypothetical protein
LYSFIVIHHLNLTGRNEDGKIKQVTKTQTRDPPLIEIHDWLAQPQSLKVIPISEQHERNIEKLCIYKFRFYWMKIYYQFFCQNFFKIHIIEYFENYHISMRLKNILKFYCFTQYGTFYRSSMHKIAKSSRFCGMKEFTKIAM